MIQINAICFHLLTELHLFVFCVFFFYWEGLDFPSEDTFGAITMYRCKLEGYSQSLGFCLYPQKSLANKDRSFTLSSRLAPHVILTHEVLAFEKNIYIKQHT